MLKAQRIYFLVVLIVLGYVASGCGKSEDPINRIPNNPTVTIPGLPAVPAIDPVTNLPVTPTCKAFNSVWSTLTVPENTLMGQHTAANVISGYPIYALDLTNFTSSSTQVTLLNDSTHSCFYSAFIASDHYILLNFAGCNPGVIPPGGTANDQCNYCPNVAPSATALNIEYDYALSCSSLTITNKNTAKSITYY